MLAAWSILGLAVIGWWQVICVWPPFGNVDKQGNSPWLQVQPAETWLVGRQLLSPYKTVGAAGAEGQLLAPGQGAEDRWSRAARDALRRGGFPWYDRSADALRRIDVSPPLAEDLEPVTPRLEFGALIDALIRWFFYSLLAAALVLLAAAILRFYWRYRAGKPLAEKPSIVLAGSSGNLPLELAGANLDFLAEAQRCYRQGDYSRAIIFLFAHQLWQLDRHKIIALERGTTNRQYLRQIGSRGPLKQIVERTMTAFEDVFFGNRQISRERFEQCWETIEVFHKLLQRGAG